MGGLLRRWIGRAKSVWQLAKTERTTPREMAWAAFIGLFLGASPLVGVRSWLALGVATAFKKNRLWTYLFSHLSGTWILAPWIMLVEVQVSHRLRTGDWVPLGVEGIKRHGAELLVDWCLGAALVGTVIGLVGAAIAYPVAQARERAFARRALAAAQPPVASGAGPGPTPLPVGPAS